MLENNLSNFLTRDQAVEYHPLVTGPDTPLSEVITQMIQGYGRYQGAVLSEPQTSSYILIMVGEKLLGIFTERDVVKLTTQEIKLANTAVAEVMSKNPIAIKLSEFTDPFRAIELFRRHRIRHLPVLDAQEQLVGVVTSHSLRHSLKSADLLRFRLVAEVMSSQVITAPPTATVITLARLMMTHRVSCVVITESLADNTSNQLPVGIMTERDILKLRNQNLDLNTTLAEAVMSGPLVYIAPEDSLWYTHQKMQELNVQRLVVTSQGMLAGIVTQTSILSTLNPADMYNTIQVLQQEVNRLQDERIELLQAQKSCLESQVQTTEQRFQAIFNQTFQMIGLLAPDGTTLEANQTALDFGGLQREEVVGRPFWETPWWSLNAATQSQLQEAIARAAQGEFVRYEVELMGVEGIRTVDFSLRPILDASGQVTLIIPEGRDISDRKRLSWEANHDPLTGLVNRRYFEQKLAAMREIALQEQQQHVLCYLDLDKFKLVNDTSGHLAGDELLRQLTKILKEEIRASDTLARLGGDEFGILLNQCPLERAIAIAEKLRQAVEQFHFLWQDKTFRVGASIGLVPINADSKDLASILKAADAACYAAKNQGRNQVQVYQAEQLP